MGKKKFIDKKKSATFVLTARDSSDPNYNKGPFGDRVFVRVDDNPYTVDSFDEYDDNVSHDAKDSDSIFADAPDDYDDEDESGAGVSRRQTQSPLMPSGVSSLPDHVRREILELGFPDDGYNYLGHLREIMNTGGGSAYYQNPKAKLDQLQNDVKAYDASRIEISKENGNSYEKLIYNVASKTVAVRIQKVVDPEVAALLDDSDLSRFGSDIEDLEEDFVVNANLPEDSADVELDKKLSLVEEPVMKEVESFEAKSSFSQENMLKSFGGADKKLMQDKGDWIDEKPRVRRLLDEQFDLLEHQEYGMDSEDEYDGFIDEESEYHEPPLAEKLNHALKHHARDDLALEESYKAPSDLLDDEECAADVIQKCVEYAEKYENESPNEDVVVVEESSDESEVWDCETIVSTYSNLDNHPGKIGAPYTRRKKKLAETLAGAFSAPSNVISLKGKEKLPVDFLPPCSKKSATEKVKVDSSLRTELQKRNVGQESKEEKKERKAAVKEERREARRAKKETKGMYKCEARHAQKVAAFTGPSSIHLM